MSYTPAETPADPKVERELRRVGEAFNNPRLIVWHRAPNRPGDGMIVICDGVDWNPLGDGIKRPLWYDMGVPSWKKFA